MSNEAFGNFNLRVLSAFTSTGSSRVFKRRNAGRTVNDLQPDRNLPLSFENRPKTSAAVHFNGVQRYIILLPAGPSTHPGTSQ